MVCVVDVPSGLFAFPSVVSVIGLFSGLDEQCLPRGFGIGIRFVVSVLTSVVSPLVARLLQQLPLTRVTGVPE